MKFLIQRVTSASVTIKETQTTNSIDKGFLVYVGVSIQDIEENRQEKVDKFVRRVGKYDLFSDEENKKSEKLQDINGSILIISNFTLYGRNKKGGSIDFCHAAPYEKAEEVYTYLIKQLHTTGLHIQTGEFGAMMEVESVNYGPVNVLLEW